ncbi:hypothetical protein BDAP_000458 [Binucleata daphniae]
MPIICKQSQKNSDNKIPGVYHQKYELTLPIEHKIKKIVFDNDKSIYTLVCYMLNYISDYIIAFEATFIMSYDIASDKSVIEKIITHYMGIVENWNNTEYRAINPIQTDTTFIRPKFKKNANAKNKKITTGNYCIKFH